MFEINPHALYSRSDLLEGLQPMGIDADTWLARIKPTKRFRMAWTGRDLLDAMQRAEPLAERGGDDQPSTAAISVMAALPGRRRGRPRKSETDSGGRRLIGGLWTREELGIHD